ncbi:MAG: ATP-binding protein, partial [Candidatus Latescibacterota bacterium]
TQPNGTVTVSTACSAPEEGEGAPTVQIAVADTGCGIPAQNLGKLFDPFFTTKEVGKGTGLGLAVSLGIVQRHGGTIRVHSEVGRGSTFTIRLPAAGKPGDGPGEDPRR